MMGMGRETGLAEDLGQARPRMPGMLNPGDFGAMTAMLDVRSWWRGKSSTLNGLTAIADTATGKMANQAGTTIAKMSSLNSHLTPTTLPRAMCRVSF